MSTLLEALSEGFDTANSKMSGGDYARKLEIYKNLVVNEYMKYNIDLNKIIAKIAKQDNLNDDQIQRIVEEVNNQVYLIKYNQMKNSPDREVIFDLASLKKVKEEISGTPVSNATVQGENHQADLGYKGLEKKASWGDDNGDSLNMFNYSPYEFTSLSPNLVRTKENIELEKVSNELNAIDSKIKEYTEKVAESSYTVANALIQYSMHGLNVQNIFNELCKTAQCMPREQRLIKKAAEQKLEQLKECRKLPTEYTLDLSNVDITKKAEFSLKQYSFMKEAEFSTHSNQSVPIVLTDKAAIRDLNDLVKHINNIANNAQAAKENMQKKDNFIKAAGLTEEQAEKLASVGKGIVAFGKALTGATAKSAKKKLNEAAQTLTNKVNDSRLINAKKTVDNLAKASQNVNIHPRMQQPNEMLGKAFNKYEEVAKNTDKILNDNALKHPLNPSKYLSSDVLKAKFDRYKGKTELNRTKDMINQQTRRVQSDLGDQLMNAKKNLGDIEKEVDLESAQKAVQDAEKAYNKAVASRKKARGVALTGAGAGVGLAAVNKQKEKENSGIYY